MSEEATAAMDGLPAAELEPADPVEAASSATANAEEDTAGHEPTASVRETESDIVGADGDAAAGTEAATVSATAPGEGSNAADNPAEEQQRNVSSMPPAVPDSGSPADTEAAPAEAAAATAEEGAEQQTTHAVYADAEHAVGSAPNGTDDSAVKDAAAAGEPELEAAGEQQAAEAAQQPRQSTHSQASCPASSSQAAAISEPKHKAAAAAEVPKLAPAATPGAAKQHAEEQEDAAPATHTAGSKPHKETAAERLTTPTAMRMLKTLQQTQGDKAEWHIASGVVYKSKKLAPDEMAAMVDRLCVAKHQDDDMPPKLHAVKLVYDDNGREVYEPVKEVTKQENISYMAELYSRCQETRAKTQQQLADKYLQPLVKPKAKSPSKPEKAPAAETA